MPPNVAPIDDSGRSVGTVRFALSARSCPIRAQIGTPVVSCLPVRTFFNAFKGAHARRTAPALHGRGAINRRHGPWCNPRETITRRAPEPLLGPSGHGGPGAAQPPGTRRAGWPPRWPT
jgi:hypothetical protein